MASSPYISTEETTNANRACRLLLGPCTDQLRDVLRHRIPPSRFPHVIVQQTPNLPRLSAAQRDLILPRGRTYVGNYDDMDISLLYILLRNICNIAPHTNGWGYDPDNGDKSLSANIERIRIARNKCVHSSTPSLPNAEFNSIWSNVRSSVVDIDAFLSNGNQYEKEVDFLRHETMDSIRDGHFREELRKQAEEDRETRDMIQDIKCKVKEIEEDRVEIHTKVQKIIDEVAKTRRSAIPANVKALYDNDVLQWVKEDAIFYETHNFPAMLETVKKKNYVFFVGVSGSGKSATVHHIALKLQKEGYEIVPIRDIRKIEEYCDTQNPQVFVIDDVIGIFGLQETKLHALSDYKDRIQKPAMSISKTLMTCRETVFRKARYVSSFFSDDNNVVMLHSKENDLNDNDKTKIMKLNHIDENFLSTTDLASTSKMFPLLCRMFSVEGNLKSYGPSFFLSPVPYLLGEFNEMKKLNKIHYAALILCLMNENKISQNILDKATEEKHGKMFFKMKNEVLQKCKICSQIDNFEFLDALSEMEGTYTKCCNREYTFIHDTMFEVIAYHFGKQFPELIIQYMNSSYIANFIKPLKCKVSENENESDCKANVFGANGEVTNEEGLTLDLVIHISENQYPLLAVRLYRDIEDKKLFDVFGSDILKHPEVRQSFINLLNRKKYVELKSVFLTGQIEICKKPFGEMSGQHTERRKLLMDERQQPFSAIRIRIRAISWVIYYGHSQILQYILEQCARHNKTLTDLFEKYCNDSCRDQISILTNRMIFRPAFVQMQDDSAESKSIIEQARLLVLSCYSGDIETVKILLKHVNRNSINRTPEYISDDGFWCSRSNTPLMAACEAGNVRIVSELLKQGATVNHQGNNRTPLTVSCAAGHMDVVAVLLKKGANIHQKDNIDTPLISACKHGHMNVVRKLLERGADVNQQGKDDTPLTAACDSGHTELLRILLKAGADINSNETYESPLMAACTSGQLGVVKELITLGADINLRNRDGNTPLMGAWENEHTSIVEELLKAGADVELQNKNGYTLMHLIALGFSKTDSQILQKLVDFDADFTVSNNYGVSPLYAALLKSNQKVVKLLITENNKCKLNNTKLHLVNILIDIKHGNVQANRKDDIVVTDRRVWRMDKRHGLWESIMYWNCDSLKHLLFLGLSADQHFQLFDGLGRPQDKSDVKPLLFAVIDEHPHFMVEKVKVLLQAGVDVNTRVKYEKNETELDKEGVSVLERTRQWISYHSRTDKLFPGHSVYKAALTVIKKNLRRYSV